MATVSQILRLSGRHLGSTFLPKNGKFCALTFVRPVTIKPQVAQEPSSKGHDQLNMELGRPMSPHLTIYAVQLTSTLSITHRLTGAALAGYAVLFGVGSVVLPHDIPHYIDLLATAPAICTYSLKFLLAFPMCYHYFNGIRHLAWDMGKFLTIKEVYSTGYIMLAATLVSTAILCVM